MKIEKNFLKKDRMIPMKPEFFKKDSPIIEFLKQRDLGKKLVLEVLILKSLFRSDESGWSVYLVQFDDRTFPITGTFVSPLRAGFYYIIEGRVSENKNKRVLSVSRCEIDLNTTDETKIIGMLQTIDEINVYAAQFVDVYGKDIIKDMINCPDKVAKVFNVSVLQVSRWASAFTDDVVLSGIKKDLKEWFGLSDEMILKFFSEKDVSDISVEMESIKKNPFYMKELFPSIRFSKCDQASMMFGNDYNSVDRLLAGIHQVLRSAAMDGHTCLPMSDFYKRLHELLDINLDVYNAKKIINTNGFRSEDIISVKKYGVKRNILKSDIEDALFMKISGMSNKPFKYLIKEITDEDIDIALSLLSSGGYSYSVIRYFVNNCEYIMLDKYDNAEFSIMRNLLDLSNSCGDVFYNNKLYLDQICNENSIILEDKQYQAADLFTRSSGGVYILNGSAGCGKTFVLKIIIKVLERIYENEKGRDFDVKILAPTGKAAKVANNSTGLPASTIHKALNFIKDMSSDTDKSFNANNDTLASCDCIVVDEFSMVDIVLSKKLFEAINNGTKVIILGDTEQLPSIGPGKVLIDLIKSKCFTNVTLNVVKRQALESGILKNATAILSGRPIVNYLGTSSVIDNISNVNVIKKMIVDTYINELRNHSILDVQVLALMKKGTIGVYELNYAIQSAIQDIFGKTPDNKKVLAKTIQIKNDSNIKEDVCLYFKPGDKVIHTKNNYDMVWYDYYKDSGSYIESTKRKGIINGDIGIITDIEILEKSKTIIVKYDDMYVKYTNSFDELEHAYATTVHKAQGSEWLVTISPISRSNNVMLNRNMLYTMCTRATLKNYIIGDRFSMDYAVKNVFIAKRYTLLLERLIDAL